MDLSSLVKLKGKQRKAKRVGRGIGSGKGGHTSGRGQKGQKSRSGNSIPFGFEGGQVPMYKKMPKRKGFVNSHKKDIVIVNLDILNIFEEGTLVKPETLLKKNILRSLPEHGVKILGTGKIEKKLTFEGFIYSQTALEKLKKAGCEIK
ncbi:MAG: 50S ribosomal protein L15 [Patescibacteria group bacterium]